MCFCRASKDQGLPSCQRHSFRHHLGQLIALSVGFISAKIYACISPHKLSLWLTASLTDQTPKWHLPAPTSASSLRQCSCLHWVCSWRLAATRTSSLTACSHFWVGSQVSSTLFTSF